MSRHYPRKLQKLASQLSETICLILGYAGHNGTIDRHHPLMEKVRGLNQDFMRSSNLHDSGIKQLSDAQVKRKLSKIFHVEETVDVHSMFGKIFNPSTKAKRRNK